MGSTSYPHGLAGCYPANMSRIVETPRAQHGHQDAQRAIGHGTERTTVRVPALTKSSVAFPALLVVLRTDPGPVVARVAKPDVAPVTHHDPSPLPTLFRHRGNARVCPERVVVSVGDGLR